jgi:protein-tyrosine phosphatase
MEAISILGKEVMQPSGLAGLGKDSLDYCGTEITEILEIFAEPISYPILIHCTQGKDRTGLIITILLLLLDVPVEAIDFDYRMSEEEYALPYLSILYLHKRECSIANTTSRLRPEHAARMAEISSIGLTEEFALCPAGWVSSIDQYLKNRFGGVTMYLRLIGVSAESEAPIVRVLRGDDEERMDGKGRE